MTAAKRRRKAPRMRACSNCAEPCRGFWRDPATREPLCSTCVEAGVPAVRHFPQRPRAPRAPRPPAPTAPCVECGGVVEPPSHTGRPRDPAGQERCRPCAHRRAARECNRRARELRGSDRDREAAESGGYVRERMLVWVEQGLVSRRDIDDVAPARGRRTRAA